MRTPQISLVAYTALKGRVFVKIPNEPGRWVLTDHCVVTHPCQQCAAAIGEPCRRNVKAYGVTTHYTRRRDADRRYGKNGKPPHPELKWGIEELEQEIGIIAEALATLQESAKKMRADMGR